MHWAQLLPGSEINYPALWKQGLQKPLEKGNFYMRSNELGMTFQLLHLPVYVKKTTLITFGFCFVSLQLGSVLCSLSLAMGRQTRVFYRSLISLLPIQQGCKKAFLDQKLLSLKPLRLIYYSDRLLMRVRCVTNWKLKKLYFHISNNYKKKARHLIKAFNLCLIFSMA